MPEKEPKFEFITRKELSIGIDYCKKNIADFLDDARLIMAQGRLSHAYVSVEFAIEELGKIILLKEAAEKDRNDPFRANETIFKSHKNKSDKAWSILAPKYRTIACGNWDEALWDVGVWDGNIEASHTTRCECAFVGFQDQNFRLGLSLEPKRLNELILHIEEKVKEIALSGSGL